MSINDSYIRGVLNSSDPFVMVVKRTTTDTLYASVMGLGSVDAGFGGLMGYEEYAVGNYASLVPNLYIYTASSTTDGAFNLFKYGTVDKYDNNNLSTLSPAQSLMVSTPTGTTSAVLKADTSGTGTVADVFLAPHVDIPTDKIYTGVWYDLHDEHDNVIEYQWFKTKTAPTFPYNPHISSTVSPDVYTSQVQFVPWSMALFTVMGGRYDQVHSYHTALNYVDKWIQKDDNYKSEKCDGDLDSTSAVNCLFTQAVLPGMGDHQVLAKGYNYCDPGQVCSTCYGKCASGKDCMYNPTSMRFTCGAQYDHVTKSSNHVIGTWTVVLVVVLILIGLGVWYGNKYMRNTHNSIPPMNDTAL